MHQIVAQMYIVTQRMVIWCHFLSYKIAIIFGCSYDQIYIEQSFLCVHFSSFVHQCERLVSSCCVAVILTAFTAEEGAQH